MKTTFKLYHEEKPEGIVLATVSDESQSNVLLQYYLNVYDNDNFKVTMKKTRQKEKWFCGNWNTDLL